MKLHQTRWLLIAFLLVLSTLFALAQDAAAVVAADPSASATLPTWLTELAAKAPWLVVVWTCMGIARTIFKPLCVFIHAVVAATPSKKDDEWVEKQEQSKWFKWLSTALDYVGSIKLTAPPKP